jgi:hypothetical protein
VRHSLTLRVMMVPNCTENLLHKAAVNIQLQEIETMSSGTLDTERLIKEVTELRELLRKEKAYRIEVEEERNVLLAENERLIEDLKRTNSVSKNHLAHESVIPDISATVILSGDDSYVSSEQLRVCNASSGKNVLSVAFATLPLNGTNSVTVLIVGGSDNSFSGYNSVTGGLLFSLSQTAPVLFLDVWETSVAAGMMDGSMSVVRKLSFTAFFITYVNHLYKITFCYV